MYETVELWTLDEHRIGLKPVLARVWAPRGERPVVRTEPRYEWLYLYGFVQPESGETVWYILPALNTVAFQIVLDDFAQVMASDHKHILLVMDRAPWHISGKLDTPQGIEIIHQPSYSPELQPAEHLWGLSDELVKNRNPDDLDDLEQRLTVQCERLMANPERVKAHTLFHWWPRVD